MSFGIKKRRGDCQANGSTSDCRMQSDPKAVFDRVPWPGKKVEWERPEGSTSGLIRHDRTGGKALFRLRKAGFQIPRHISCIRIREAASQGVPREKGKLIGISSDS